MNSKANWMKYGLSRFFGFFHFSLKSTWLRHTVQMDANGCKLMQMDANGCKWMQMDANGCKWMQMV